MKSVLNNIGTDSYELLIAGGWALEVASVEVAIGEDWKNRAGAFTLGWQEIL